MKNTKCYCFFSVIFVLGGTTVPAQSGVPFDLSHNVIAAGGGSNSTGGSGGQTFRVDGTIGQAIAGVTSTGNEFNLTGGFWQPSLLVPTASGVSVSGRVLRSDGSPVYRAMVQLLDTAGVRRTAVTNLFGRFRLGDLEPGQTYIIDVRHRVARFAPLLITPTQNVVDLELTALP